MILIGLHDKGQITARGASVRSIRMVEVYRSEGDVVRVTVDPTDWLDVGTLSTITLGGAAQTITNGKATFNLAVSDGTDQEIAVTATNGRRRSFVIRFVSDTVAPEPYG